MAKRARIRSIPEPPLTTGDIARYCHTTVMQVNRWIKSGALKAFQNPGGQNRIVKEEFRSFLEKHGMPVVEEFFREKEGKKILVADDDRTVVEAIRYLLKAQPESFEVEVCRDGYDTLIKAGDFKPDLVILDIRMPRIDGLEVCRRLRENESIAKGMKILAITGHSEAYEKDQVLSSGANDYLLKPFEKNVFLDHVKQLID